jgi:hypothetical protein
MNHQHVGRDLHPSKITCARYSGGDYIESMKGDKIKSQHSELLLDKDGTFKFFEKIDDSMDKERPRHEEIAMSGHWKVDGDEARFDVEAFEPEDLAQRRLGDGARSFSVPLAQLQDTEPFNTKYSDVPISSQVVPEFLRSLH